MNLRSESKDPFIHRLENRSLADGIRLPTNRSVLARFIYLREDNKLLPSREIFKTLVSEVQTIWGRAFVPTKPDPSVLFLVSSLHQKWNSMKKYGSRLTEPNGLLDTKIKDFQDILNQLFDIASDDALQQLKASRQPTWEEDWEFLNNQRNSRTGYMSGVDRKTARLEERRAIRLNNRGPKEKQNALSDNDIAQLLSDTGEENSECDDIEQYEPNSNKKKQKVDNASLILPTASLLEETSELSDRCGLSIRDQLLEASRLVNVVGGNIGDFSLSVSTAWRQRNAAREQIAKDIKEKWIKDKPKYAVLHWDSKMMTYFSGKKEERVAILVSGANSGY